MRLTLLAVPKQTEISSIIDGIRQAQSTSGRRSFGGKLFQIRGPAAETLRSPTLLHLLTYLLTYKHVQLRPRLLRLLCNE